MSTNFGSYKVVTGDATNPQAGMRGTPILIPHVCNNVGAWGAGFVMALNRAFGGGPMTAYKAWHEEAKGDIFSPQYLKPNNVQTKESGRFGLGEVQYVRIGNGITIANMVAQKNIAGPHHKQAKFPPIRYGALIDCMRDIAYTHQQYADKTHNFNPFEIHCPFFGSDLAGGSWEEIEKIIHEVWVENGITVVAYKFEPTNLDEL